MKGGEKKNEEGREETRTMKVRNLPEVHTKCAGSYHRLFRKFAPNVLKLLTKVKIGR